MAFQELFTGKGVAPVLPSGDGLLRSQERASDQFIDAEKIKLDTYRKNAEEFQKASQVDPVFLLGDSAQKAQANLLKNFNEKYGKIYAQYKGMIPEDVKQRMQTDKNMLIMEQQKMKSDMEQALQARDAVEKDFKNMYDKKDFEQRWGDYVTTGRWDASPLMPSAIDPDVYFSEPANKIRGTEGLIDIKKKEGGNFIRKKFQASGTEEQGREFIASKIFDDDRFARGIIEKFAALKNTDPKTYIAYLDNNPKDGVVSPAEEKQAFSRSNPILKWAQDNYWDKALDMKEAVIAGPASTSASGGGEWRTSTFGRYIPTSAIEAQIGNTTFKQYHAFAGTKPIILPMNKIVLLEPEKESDTSLKTKSNLTAYLTGYDRNTDRVTFLVSKDFRDIDYTAIASGAGMQVAVRREDLPKEIIDNLEIVVDGNPTKVGNLPRTIPDVNTKIPELLRKPSAAKVDDTFWK